MPTDDERREVAERLRMLQSRQFRDEERPEITTWEGIGAAVLDSETWGKCDLLRSRDNRTQAVRSVIAGRLADLIEPVDRNDELCAHCDYCDYCDLPECSEQDGYSFKPKGYVDLLVLADKTIRSARHDMEICGDTVPSWYAAGRLEAVARSIREILGVSHG